MTIHTKSFVGPLRVGLIPYWNLLPFKKELLRHAGGLIQMVSAPPVQMNRLLLDGKIHLAPCSSVCLVKYPEHEMALPLGISSDGQTSSVYLGLSVQHTEFYEKLLEKRAELKRLYEEASASGEDLRYVAQNFWALVSKSTYIPSEFAMGLKLSPASASSVSLAKIFYTLWFGPDVTKSILEYKITDSSIKRPVELLIGDEALMRRHSFHRILDLGALWKEMTGLPFVFAVWQSRGACLNGWRRKILEIGERAHSKMKVDPSYFLPDMEPLDDTNKKIPLASYWKIINYRIGPRELKGLLLFLHFTKYIHTLPLDNQVVIKLARWQELCKSSSASTFYNDLHANSR